MDESETCASPMTEDQLAIFEFLRLHTWQQTMLEFGIKSRSVMRTIVIRTALGLVWYPGLGGGQRPYLNFEKETKLVHWIEEAAERHHCLATAEVASLAFALKQESIIEARAGLLQRRCEVLATQLQVDVLPPSPTWLTRFTDRHGLHSVLAREMEEARHFGCDKGVILTYFLKFLPLFNTDPRLIFGADETDMKPGARFHVVCPESTGGFTTAGEEALSHVTAMCCHNASGVAVPPFLLLSNLRNLPAELLSPEVCSPNLCWFGSTEKGYMTEGSFYLWAVLFVTWLSGYRATCLPEPLKCAQILLIIDGCASHHCPEALDLFSKSNVTVVVLPAHTSHLLQAFDVGIASTLKAYFRKFIIDEKKNVSGKVLGKTAMSRLVLVRGFLRAWSCAASPAMCARSFEIAGICPPCPTRILQSPFITNEIAPEARASNDRFNNSVATCPECIKFFAEKLKRTCMPMLPDCWTLPDYDNLISYFRQQAPSYGRLISDPPALYMCRDSFWYVARTFARPPQMAVHPVVLMRTMRMLSIELSDRGNEVIDHLVNGQAKERQAVNEVVIRDAAKQLANEMAMEMALDKFQSVADLAEAELREILGRRIESILHESEVDKDVQRTIACNVDACVSSALRDLYALLQSRPTPNQ